MIKGRAGIYINPETVADTLVTNLRRETHFIKGGNMNIYVGNLPLEVTEDELRQEFTAFGEVISATIMNDKYIGSGQQRGYGFVQMPSQSEGKAAITALNDKTLGHMTINVVEALPLSDKKGNGSYSAKKRGWSTSRVRQRRYKIS
jgi:RNA recognition motif-containing protein